MNIPSGTLKLHSRGQLVKDLQKELKDAGFDPQGADGVFGPKTAAALKAFQRAKGLTVDGIAGKQTWTALGGDYYEAQRQSSGADPDDQFDAGGTTGTTPAMPEGADSEIRQKIVAAAYAELNQNIRESGPDNHGACEKYPGYFGRGPEKWCADFVSYVNTKAGNRLNYASCRSMLSHLKSEGHYTRMSQANPKPGDVVFFDWRDNDGVSDHVGVVVDVVRNSKGKVVELITIEGNAHQDGGGGRQGVYLHHRKVNSGMLGIGTP